MVEQMQKAPSGRYQPYPEYKDSGIEWESKLPLGWEIKSVSHYFYAKKGSFASTLTKEYCESIKGNYPVFSGQTENNGILSYINTYEFNLEKGAVLVTTVGAKAMSLKFIQGRFSLSQNCMIILSKNKCIDLRYIFYLFQVIFAYYRSLIPDHMQPSFRMEDFYSMKFFEPPLQEQTQIAQFLDYETAKIDLLIEKQQKLIELLKEKRQAVISHAVTKGLDPTVEMKDSGIEWLGEVPAHWEVVYSKSLFTERKEKSTSQDQMLTASQKYGVIPQKLFMKWEEQRVTQVLTGKDILKRAHKGDFVISMRSFQGGIEFCNYTGAISSAYIALIPKNNININYFKYLFKSNPYIQALQSTSNLVRDGQALRYNNFIQISLPAIPFSEAENIAKFLELTVQKIDQLSSKAEKQIKLLQERRTALISAAVTGKIDLRHWQMPEASNHQGGDYE